eukprot:CAMPEP_0114588984 /NCGR_PEP_ID=MMETSP0125-20121206/11555_1 /TAXON_ID=485358 ORGANISM="Aristerostoma sp., Strain ATCC 50986" /NCGR_SAMPLE_ID=MMETSP0125 /ASSEMBLY_ACC=CAM_ASM_000245 /LENGTH=144 /DNA_ID=CAMNT_0001785663 /DNA_START=107 /DNA_END=541 /DNA_ORIENTATION=-
MTSGKKPTRILMLGLDGSGKTTILYKLKLDEFVSSVPTIGFNVETVEYKKLKMTIWDVGGQTTLRNLWKHYYEGTDALIFIIDSADKDRLELAKENFFHVINDPDMINVPFLILANKQDIAQMTVADIMNKMDLHSIKGRDWKL